MKNVIQANVYILDIDNSIAKRWQFVIYVSLVNLFYQNTRNLFLW